MKKGFTLVELIIVIIIVGILASVAMGQYAKVVEKSRYAEANTILGSLRSMQMAYYAEWSAYTTDIGVLDDNIPESNSSDYFFIYSCADTGTCTATRVDDKVKCGSASCPPKSLSIVGAYSGGL